MREFFLLLYTRNNVIGYEKVWHSSSDFALGAARRAGGHVQRLHGGEPRHLLAGAGGVCSLWAHGLAGTRPAGRRGPGVQLRGVRLQHESLLREVHQGRDGLQAGRV